MNHEPKPGLVLAMCVQSVSNVYRPVYRVISDKTWTAGQIQLGDTASVWYIWWMEGMDTMQTTETCDMDIEWHGDMC